MSKLGDIMQQANRVSATRAASLQMPIIKREAVKEEDKLKEVYRRIARFKVQGIQDEQIAEMYQLSNSQFDALVESNEFRDILREVAADRAKALLDTDDQWDDLEKRSLRAIGSYVEATADPNFALRAAQVANRANRRYQQNGKASPESLDVDNARVVIKIGHFLSDKLQVNPEGGISKTLEARKVTENNDGPIKERKQGQISFIEANSSQYEVLETDTNRMHDTLRIEDLDFEAFVSN